MFVKHILIVVSFLGFSRAAEAQLQSITANSGGDFKMDGQQLSFTIGESFIQTVQGTSFMLTQGFHQPQLWVTALNEFDLSAINFKVYPNPVIDRMWLELNKEIKNGCVYRLFDMHGRLLKEGNVKGLKTEISLQQLVPSSYFLEILVDKKSIKSFKILKR